MSDLGNKHIMAENIKRYMEFYGESATDVCNAIGVKKGAFSTWVNEKAYPRIDKIEKMAMHFGCAKSDLVEEFDPSFDIPARKKLLELAYEAAEFDATNTKTITFANETDKQFYRQLLLIMKDESKRKLLETFIKGLNLD